MRTKGDDAPVISLWCTRVAINALVKALMDGKEE